MVHAEMDSMTFGVGTCRLCRDKEFFFLINAEIKSVKVAFGSLSTSWEIVTLFPKFTLQRCTVDPHHQ